MEYDYIEQGDCLELIKAIPDESIDLVLTDPPYKIVSGGNTTGKMKGGILGENNPNAKSGKMFENNDIKFDQWLPEIYRVLKDGTHCYIMINARNLLDLWNAARSAGLQFVNLLIWKKNNKTPNKYYMNQCEFILMLRKGKARNINDMGMSNFFEIENVKNKQHPTEKPVELMQILITQSTDEQAIVLDPFLWIGATALAAVASNRHYIGFEINEQYFDIACKRLDRAEGEQHVSVI